MQCQWIFLHTTFPSKPLAQIKIHLKNTFPKGPCQNYLNSFAPQNKMAVRALDKKYLKTTSPPETLVQIQNSFTEIFLIMLSVQIAKWFQSTKQDGCQSSR